MVFDFESLVEVRRVSDRELILVRCESLVFSAATGWGCGGVVVCCIFTASTGGL